VLGINLSDKRAERRKCWYEANMEERRGETVLDMNLTLER
jgi:hypothetical protein